MLQELKKQSFKRSLALIILLAIFSVMMILVIKDGVKAVLGGTHNLDEMTADQIKPGMLVEGTVYGIYDYYAYTEETENGKTKVVSTEYLIPVGEQEYMGLYTTAKYHDACEALMYSSWDYLNDKTDTIEGQFTVKGTVLPLEGDSLKFYKEYVGYDDMTPEQQADFLLYYINIDSLGTNSYPAFYLFLAAAAGLITATFYWLIKALRGGYQKNLIQYCKEHNCEDQVEAFYRSTVPVEGLRVSSRYLMGQQGAKTFLIPAEELLWSYMHVTTHKQYFITVGKTYCVMLRTKDGKSYSQNVKNEEKAREVLAVIRQRMPHAAQGYDKEWETLYQKNRAEFIRQVDERRQQMSGEFGAEML